jgi:hypothetical protein
MPLFQKERSRIKSREALSQRMPQMEVATADRLVITLEPWQHLLVSIYPLRRRSCSHASATDGTAT